MKKTLNTFVPAVCKAVKAVGIIKPKFDPSAKGFRPPELEVMGTGFWLKNEQMFVTCTHVVQHILGTPIELAGMLVVGGNGSEYKKALISILDFSRDIAVLAIEADKKFLQQESLNGLELANRAVNIGEKVSYAGFPLGNQLLNEKHSPTYAEGIVSSEVLDGKNVETKKIQISGPIVGGYSGAPIILQEEPSKIIAIVSHSPSKEAGDANIFMGIHWNHIKGIIDLVKS